MKKIYLSLYGILILFQNISAKDLDFVSNAYKAEFTAAYQANPSIPRGLLEAVSFNMTHFNHITHQAGEQGSCAGIPKTYGVMGLTLDGANYFRNNLNLVAELSAISIDDIINSPSHNIMAFANAYTITKNQLGLTSNKMEDQVAVLEALSELPNDNLQNNFAMNAYLFGILQFLDDDDNSGLYGFPNYSIDFEKVFGSDNYKVLASPLVTISSAGVSAASANYKAVNTNSILSSDYAPALWVAAGSCNQSSRNGTAVSAVTIHDVEGTYSGCISWFQNCNASVSAHYVLRSSDGQVTQMVLESGKAWHVGSENPYTIGLEHEGYRNQTGWYTTAMYNSSANLVRDICNSGYGISPLRAYNGPSCNDICTLGGCVKIKGHQHYPNQNHNDPGPNWDWYRYYNLINNNPTITTVSTSTGNIYDSGGASGNYTNDERTLNLIAPTGATTVTVTFSAFDLEANWDYLYLYDGATTSSPLIGRYTGTTSPGTVTANSGKLLLDFRSDCATVKPGFAASWTSNVNTSTADVTPPTTQVSTTNSWVSTNFTTAYADSDEVGGSGVQKSFYQVIDFDGTEWRANKTRGFFSDNFDQSAIHSDWSVKSGTWAVNASNYLEQSNQALSNTAIVAYVQQDLSNRYLYNWAGMMSGTGTNRRAGMHFFADAPDSSNLGNSYFAWFRLDNDKIQIYKVTNNDWQNTGGLKVDTTFNFTPNQWYDFKVIYDRITGIIKVYVDNVLAASWTDPSPYASGGNYISFRAGNCDYQVNNIKVYRSRAASTTINVGTAANADIRYQNPDPSTPSGRVKSIINDNAGNLSAISSQDINVDWTPPSGFTVDDGFGSDIDTTNNGTQLDAHWTLSTDTNSGISNYEYAIGTTPGGTEILNWTTSSWFNNDSASVDSLNLIPNTLYYYAVRSLNGAGLASADMISDGQLYYDLLSSTIKTVNDNTFMAMPNPFKGETNIVFSLESDSPVTLSVVDVLGREVFVMKNENMQSGRHQISLNKQKLGLAGGVYIVRLSDGKNLRVIKIAEL